MTSRDPARIVADGYDLLGSRYADWMLPRRKVELDHPERRSGTSHLLRLMERLPRGADVLDLGCGSGIPLTQRLAASFRVTGVDLSSKQLEKARGLIPDATFIEADMTALELPPAGFDAVSALYSLTHVPRAHHADLLRKIATWLRPGGWFLASMGTRDVEHWVGDWLGVPMFFSHFDSDTNRRLVQAAGLTLVEAEVLAEDEDGRQVDFLWVLARRQGGASPPPSNQGDTTAR